MLKPGSKLARLRSYVAAAFGRLCVETSGIIKSVGLIMVQPPSGGCVLKHALMNLEEIKEEAAAFGRLCVETEKHHMKQ